LLNKELCQTVYFMYLYITVHWTQRGCLTWNEYPVKFCASLLQQTSNFIHKNVRRY